MTQLHLYCDVHPDRLPYIDDYWLTFLLEVKITASYKLSPN